MLQLERWLLSLFKGHNYNQIFMYVSDVLETDVILISHVTEVLC